MAYDVITPTHFYGGSIAVSPSTTTLRTTPADSVDFLKNIMVANSSGDWVEFTLWIVPSGGSVSDQYLFAPAVEIQGKQWEWEGVQIMEAGATLVAQASASGLSAHASGANAV